MPIGIVIYEIDSAFGPSVIAEYSLVEGAKFNKEILKELSEKHVEKNLIDATTEKDEYRFFSSEISSEDIKENLYLGFILREGEDLVSLKSIFENVQQNITDNLDANKKEDMKDLLKDILGSILSLMEKLKEPAVIQETINEKTKIMLDEGKLQEARELIDLGEEIPQDLAQNVKEAEEYFKEGSYKKAKKRFYKAAELAELIQEEEIVSFLRNKAEKVGNYPDLLDEREDLKDELKDIMGDFESEQLRVFNQMKKPVESLLKITNELDQNDKFDLVSTLKKDLQTADRLAKELYDLTGKIREKIINI